MMNKMFAPALFVLCGLFCVSRGETAAYWRFEGIIDSNITTVYDEVNGKAVTAKPGSIVNPAASLKYALPEPFFGGDTSAFFNNPIPNAANNAGICLMRPDDDQLDFAGTTGLTIEAFVKPVENRQAVIVRDYGGTNNPGYWLDMIVDGRFSFHMGNGTTGYKTLYSDTNTVTVGDWQHVAGTWDGSTMRLYIDGNEANSVPYTAGLVNNTGAFGIGAIVRHSGSASNEGQYFNGYIDEVRISDTALSPMEFLNYNSTPFVQFAATSSQEIENTGTVELEVLISRASPDAVTVDYEVTAGTADGNGIDYTLDSGTITFAAGQKGPQAISININSDDIAEDDETIVVTLLNSANAIIGPNSEHTFTIIDDDTIPTVEFETTESSGKETESPATLKVKLSRAYREQVNVYFAATDGTATNGVDFDLPVGILTFEPYQTSEDISIDIFYDGQPEPAEDIEVTIFFPTNAVLGTNQQHWYTIYDVFVNTLGMEFTAIEAGTFQMGSTVGDFDEKPVHNVTISHPFYMAVTEVTNAQYEQFDPNHALIDHRGFTHKPDEAVIFVRWEDANAFCTWLSERESSSYRLPTEAEWEYACRAGTTTEYNTGDTFPTEYFKNQFDPYGAVPVDLSVAQSPANAWGLYDMHGNVEEWCNDWYGPYDANDQVDPVGRIDGDFKVSRGGSHSTTPFYLRSANRIGTVPEDNHWLLGFRVVMAALPETQPLPKPQLQQFQLNVSQEVPADIYESPDPTKPYFYGPRRYVWIPPELNGGPLYTNHNHVPGIVECRNGDLLAVWYSTISERGRELGGAVSRLRYGAYEWEDASVFWNAPDRNDHSPAVWADEAGKLYHFQGLGVTSHGNSLATIMRTSTDNGVTWTKAKLIIPEHDKRHMPIESIFRLSDGKILLPCDAVHGGNGGTAIFLSDDNGQTWYDPGAGQPIPGFVQGGTGAWIAGIHAPVVELSNGNLLSYGRGDNINNMMPQSISTDGGYNWTYSASIFPPIASGKRAVMITLKEGPVFFASFGANGLFGCVSYDDGATWTPQRLITDDGPGRLVESTDGGLFTLSATSAEPRGYLSVWQGKNGLIHLISSREHYVFNLKHIDAGYKHPLIDGDDLEIFGSQWLSDDPNAAANFDAAGNVDLSDYSIFADYWLEPEPANWPLNE